ncbi:hypothetical protein JCM19238_4098 [Vibrio ponticus]|nr:hypothetical protein JCM19238_4098 [Vibrio ponticus]
MDFFCDYDENRVDHAIIRLLYESKDPVSTYLALKSDINIVQGSCRGLLAEINDLELTDVDIETNSLALLDYFFEPYFLKSMNSFQVSRYCNSINDKLQISIVNNKDIVDGPIFIEAVHTVNIFSIAYILGWRMKNIFLKNKVILFYRNVYIDVRAQKVAKALSDIHGIHVSFIRLDGKLSWYKEYKKKIDSDTVVMSFTDLPAALFKSNLPSSKLNIINKDKTATFDVISPYKALCDRGTKYNYFRIENQRSDIVSCSMVTQNDTNNKGVSCQFRNWVFTSALNLY